MKKILVGSRAFFGSIDGFTSKDYDYIELVDNPQGFAWRKEMIIRGVCTFQYKKEAPQEMIRRTLESGEPLLIGKFLVPEVAAAIGATSADLKPLEALLDRLDPKHRYVAYIFRAIQENGSFSLTDEQRQEAYKVYQEARQDKSNPEQEITPN